MAGSTVSEISPDILEKTSIWYHIGLSDQNDRVQRATLANEFILNYWGNAVEKTVEKR